LRTAGTVIATAYPSRQATMDRRINKKRAARARRGNDG
jgi:hypothetical protein